MIKNKLFYILEKYLILIIVFTLIVLYLLFFSKGYFEYTYRNNQVDPELKDKLTYINIIHSDGNGYFSYLPFFILKNTDNITLNLKYNIGVSLLILPFFLVAHLLSVLLKYPINGFSFFYQHSVGIASITYCALAFYFLKKLLLKYYNKKIVVLTLILIFFGTNIIHYSTFDASFSHIYSFFLYSMFLYILDKFYEKQASSNYSIYLGATLGFLFLVKTINILLVIFLIFYGINNFKDIKSRFSFFIKKYRSVLLLIFFFILTIAPQTLIWKKFYGHFFVNTYSDEKFWFLRPNIMGVLFSIQKGLFFWFPLMVFITIGFFLLNKNSTKKFLIPSVFYFLIILFLNSSWHMWWFGSGFGHRGFTESFSILSIPLAAFISNIENKSKKIKLIIFSLSFIFISWTLTQMSFYWSGLVPFQDTRFSTYLDIFKLSSTNLIVSKILDFIDIITYDIRITNYLILIPIIFLFIATISYFLFLLKKRIIFIIPLIVFVFLTIISIFFFYSPLLFLKNDTNKIIDSMQNSKEVDNKKLFRVLPIFGLYAGISDYNFWYNKYIYFNNDIIKNHSPLVLNDYYFDKNLGNGIRLDKFYNKLILNNNILSMLNIKYIMFQKPNNIEDYVLSLNKILPTNNNIIIDNFKKAKIEKGEKYITLSENTLILDSAKDNSIKIVNIPVNIKNNTDYIIIFQAMAESPLDNNIHFDFFGANYDSNNQEFYLLPSNFIDKKDFITIKQIINSNSIPKNTEVYFRIFTQSQGKIIIKNLEIAELKNIKENNYKLALTDGIIILENLKSLDRFYLPNKLLFSKNKEDVINKIWENDVIWFEDKFNVRDTAIIKEDNFKEINFNNDNYLLKILNYSSFFTKLYLDLPEDRFLVFSEIYYPGWKVVIDNLPSKIYNTNSILLGCFVPKGKHVVVFYYRPSNFWFIITTVISLSLLLSIFLLFYLKKSKNSKGMTKNT